MKTLILSRKDIGPLLDMKRALDAVESAFAAHGRGEAVMPPKVYLPLEKYEGDFRAMPAYLDGAAGVKWVNAHPNNPSKHKLPAVMALYVLSDPDNAAPLAIMDGTLLTAFRTGAAGGVGSKYLAKKEPATLGFIGCGVQARYLLSAHRELYSNLKIIVADARPEAAEAFAKESGGTAGTTAEAAGCDIVCTSTPSRKPIVRRDWVKAGAHINAMGADAPGKQELDPSILLHARVVVDDPGQGFESGEVNVPLESGSLKEEHIHGTLGEIVAGKKKGREGDEISVFDSTGLAIQDLAVARLLFAEAKKKGVGQEIEIVG